MDYLSPKFFNRDSHSVAIDLIGQKLCRDYRGKVLKLTINEVEVYDGPDDQASHAHGMSGTSGRSQIMFGPAGIWYVYLCYGIHWMLNVVTREEGYPAALLIRGCSEVSGPGRLTKHLNITSKLNGLPVDPASKLWIERPEKNTFRKAEIIKTPRIGVNYAGPHWAGLPYRYVVPTRKKK